MAPSPEDPRFLRSRDAIVGAARELLMTHGPGAITHARVAEQAGIARATVYRHWPRTDQLLAAAMATVPMPFFDAPGTPTRDWLIRELAAIARQLDHHDVRVVTTTLANTALWEQDMDARREGFAELLTARLVEALEEARARGEVDLRTDPRHAAALAIGPIYYRATIEHGTADDAFITTTVENLGRWR
ncbi:TetR/AcrR family transcriptional regulator [Kineosporia sp. NBRC 101731]|uniref:TetR/AcrR family transcriptional regulator n=1 Tax=Kineosporia sp. NBRC 101731 TaxID=3032199 RepID=UPI0024A454B7|nr:TetR/AcrR family transcriptional regulator [Kineosporia sp. NBRC 101731]GLY30771.1 TetR family transcriptional regulator [Kineosporia sp. NBRC 101731]